MQKKLFKAQKIKSGDSLKFLASLKFSIYAERPRVAEYSTNRLWDRIVYMAPALKASAQDEFAVRSHHLGESWDGHLKEVWK